MELTEEHFGEMFCVTAVGARIKRAVLTLREARDIIAINGCDSRCVTRLLKDLGLKNTCSVSAAALGVEKRPGFFSHVFEVERIKEAAIRALVER
jgi:uncharacterized metal-binding protein